MTSYSDALLEMAGSQLGYSEVNGASKYGEWFGENVAKEAGYKNAAWCDMFVSWAAHQTGQADVVGQFAWTPAHARWFEKQGAWGTTPKPGAVVFFDWGGSKNISAIDHVGLVKSVISPTTITTIEGNISNAVVTRTRDQDTIVGYGYPDKVREIQQKAEAAAQPVSAPFGPPPEPVSIGAVLLPLALIAVHMKRSGYLTKLLARIRG
ncbi:CHAP domain-containing protein [Acrocarpospora catenulata]|uniref:CHAP domain-containing protein n=1 Tax=Acrocarpospora catenulata TaxID=2836182 RepID=UPI001BDA73D5|nr:CHAP domain-containing protein [Acrocarpospora catenulata]